MSQVCHEPALHPLESSRWAQAWPGHRAGIMGPVLQRWGGSHPCPEFPPAGSPAFDPKAAPLIAAPPGAGTSLTGPSHGSLCVPRVQVHQEVLLHQPACVSEHM